MALESLMNSIPLCVATVLYRWSSPLNDFKDLTTFSGSTKFDASAITQRIFNWVWWEIKPNPSNSTILRPANITHFLPSCSSITQSFSLEEVLEPKLAIFLWWVGKVFLSSRLKILISALEKILCLLRIYSSIVRWWSKWSSVILSMVAASNFWRAVLSNWKLDNSRI